MSVRDVPRRRTLVLASVATAMFAALLGRLWFLQVLDTQTFQVQADEVRLREVRIPAPRGQILDRNGTVLADNRLVGEVAFDVQEFEETIDDPDERAARLTELAELLGRDPAEVLENYEESPPPRPAVVATDVDEDLLVVVKERQARFPGVVASLVPKRVYPFGSLASHVIGYVGEINDAELGSRADDGYLPGETIGKMGVERSFESELRGTPGVERYEVDRLGRVVRELEPTRPIPGNDVHLTIDLDIQRSAELALLNGLGKARQLLGEQSGLRLPAPAGAAVVTDPRNGDVLAMASYPDFNPNEFVGGIDPELWRRLTHPASYHPLNNRAIQGLYQPGSAFKLVSAVAGLDSGVINLGTTVFDDGTYEVDPCDGDKCSFRNSGEVANGFVNLSESIEVSSDFYYYRVGDLIQRTLDEGEDEAIQDTARKFGFGSSTGVQLPFELAGRIPDREVKRRLHEQNPEAFPFGGWTIGDNVILAIGQTVVGTPLQLANAYATFANHGVRYQPNIATRVESFDGELLREAAPREHSRIALDRYYDSLAPGFTQVTRSFRGTATDAFAGYDHSRLGVAGKTGTAQELGQLSIASGREKEDTAVFAGYAPSFGEAEFALAVVMEEAGFGGTAAAPVARVIFEDIAALREADPERFR